MLYGYVPLRFGGNVVRRMGTQQRVDVDSKVLQQRMSSAVFTINGASVLQLPIDHV